MHDAHPHIGVNLVQSRPGVDHRQSVDARQRFTGDLAIPLHRAEYRAEDEVLGHGSTSVGPERELVDARVLALLKGLQYRAGDGFDDRVAGCVCHERGASLPADLPDFRPYVNPGDSLGGLLRHRALASETPRGGFWATRGGFWATG